jgi:hypothetical protein
MYWTEVNFGKYKDLKKTLPEIIFEDPDYFIWGMEEGIFHKAYDLSNEANDLFAKIRAIKIPENEYGDFVCEFYKNPRNGKIDFQICERAYPSDYIVVDRRGVIDLCIPRDYDRSIGATKNVLPQLFFVLFGERRMPSKSVMEEFFANDENFSLEF